MMNPTEAESIISGLRALNRDNDVVELRALTAGRSQTVSGYFDCHEALAREADRWDGRAIGIYFTLHEINPALLARAANRAVERARTTTGDSDVRRYRWLPIDLDPERPAGISSKDVEHEAALALAVRVQDWLVREIGVPAESIVRADSGNGAHVLVRIDEPADAATRTLIERSLKAIDLRWGSPEVKVDTSNANPSRIWKLYGTLAAKGDPTPDRPHRRSRILEATDRPAPVGREVLERLAALAPEDPQLGPRQRGDAFDVERWLVQNAIAVARSRPWHGGVLYELDGCPMDDTHERDRAAHVIRHSSGAISAGCLHDRCRWWKWADLRSRYEPDYADRAGGSAKGANFDTSDLAPFVRLSSVERRAVPWLWPGKIPLGRTTVLDGDPDVGKSTIAYDLAARVTTGTPMPFEQEALIPPSGVVVLSAEDDAADTIRPRLEAAGADIDRVAVFRLDNLPDLDEEGLARIAEAIAAVDAKLVIVDPLMAFIPEKRDTHRDHHIRRALRPLSALCERTGVAVLVIRHLNQSGGTNAKYRGGGSIGITGAARSVMLAAEDPDNADGFVLARVKGNLAPPWASLSYKLVSAGDCPVVEWTGTSQHTAAALLAAQIATPTRIDEAMDFLAEELSEGRRPQKDVAAKAGGKGISERTLDRAKADLGIVSGKDAFDGQWYWSLPTPPATGQAEGCQTKGADVGTLRAANHYRGVI